MKDLVFLQGDKALTDSLIVGEKRINLALKVAKETYSTRLFVENNGAEPDFYCIASCLNEITKALYEFEDATKGIYTTLNALDEIVKYMTYKEFITFQSLLTLATQGIIAFYFPNGKPRRDKTCVYILLLSNQTVKIGVTCDSYERNRTIENSSGLQIVNWCRSDYLERKKAFQIETSLHHIFAAQRIHGEFFYCSYSAACVELQKYTPIVEQYGG